MTAPVRFLAAMFALGRNARIDIYATCHDLIASGIAIETALDTMIDIARGQRATLRARILGRWRAALVRDGLAAEIALWVPPAEALLFRAYGLVDAQRLFSGALRVAILRDKQAKAVWQALAMPALLFAAVFLSLYGSGGWFVPTLELVVPPERWDAVAAAFRRLSLTVYGDWPLIVAGLAGLIAVVWTSLVAWTGAGRTAADSVAPWSLYRTLTGSAFLFVAVEYVRSGLDLNDRAFALLSGTSSPYGRSRIGAIQREMAQGANLGDAMTRAGHGFPDPTLVPVIRALSGTQDWEHRLGGYIDRWAERVESLLRERAAILNGALMCFAAVLIAGAIQAMFSVMSAAGGV